MDLEGNDACEKQPGAAEIRRYLACQSEFSSVLSEGKMSSRSYSAAVLIHAHPSREYLSISVRLLSVDITPTADRTPVTIYSALLPPGDPQ